MTTIRIKADKDYHPHLHGRTVCKLKKTDNGYIAKFPALTSTQQDYYVCLDFSQATELHEALTKMFKEEPCT